MVVSIGLTRVDQRTEIYCTYLTVELEVKPDLIFECMSGQKDCRGAPTDTP